MTFQEITSPTPLEFLRIIEAAVGLACFVVLLGRLVINWKEMSQAQKIFHAGNLFLVMAVVWDISNLWRNQLPLSLRVVPYSLGILLLFIYILEPHRSFKKRVGNEPFSNSKDDE